MTRRGARTVAVRAAAALLVAAIGGCGPSGAPLRAPGEVTAGELAGEGGGGAERGARDGAGRSPGSGRGHGGARPASGATSANGVPGGDDAPAGPGAGSGAVPPVVDHVPTRDKIVFLTYDDGAERDPRFIDLVRERRLPVSMFLTDSVVGPGYAHFARLRAVGASLQNHTLDHPALRGLPYPGQRAEICGQQRKLHSRFGVRPRLFRPPYGAYDTTTLRAAADCGIEAVVLWRASVDGAGRLSYTRGAPRPVPGDVISVPSTDPPSLSLADRTVRLLRQIEKRGLKVGRLEDYIGRRD
ncbi:polysaccharide deacetylase family protein [Streptomyces sp. NPDC005931]|uniref:polysaccharide deacetylase family protein n=1 Tax=Streptomyces sp. NPDC005931 TaxID=3364737 RepID=UPI0036854DAB